MIVVTTELQKRKIKDEPEDDFPVVKTETEVPFFVLVTGFR